MSTYPVARGARVGSTPAATARPAMTIENSPRGVSTRPARHRPSGPMPARRAAYEPDTSLVRIVTAASSVASPASPLSVLLAVTFAMSRSSTSSSRSTTLRPRVRMWRLRRTPSGDAAVAR